MADHSTAKTHLEAQLHELGTRLAHLEGDLAEPADPDLSEQAVQQEDDAPLEGQIALVRREITATAAALDRITDGTYGECVACGAAISAGRLNASPEAALCIDCASRS